MRYDQKSATLIAAVILAFAPVPLANAAGADEQQEFRCPKPGAVIEISTGDKITFAEQDGMYCTGTITGGKPWRRYAVVGAPGTFYVENKAERIWPLQIGKEIQFKFQGSSNNSTGGVFADTPFWYEEKIVAVRRERVTVPAGTFDTWVVEDHQDVARGKFSSVMTYWYSPEVGFPVKFSYHIALGIGKDSAWEAKTISSAVPVVATPAPTPPSPPPVSAAPSASGAPPSAPVKVSPPAMNPSSPGGSSTTAQRLQELKDLLDRKLITPAEYETKRKAILDAL